jgi:uncharacterized damage-inducible protein DinB
MNKEEFLQSVAHEITIIKHLATTIPADKHDHRLTEKQRSTIELLQYLARIGIALTLFITSGDDTVFKTQSEKFKDMKAEDFAACMDAEQKDIENIVSGMSEEELNGDVSMFGTPMPRRIALINYVLKHLVAYRMQLFLQIKQSGNHGIATSDVWSGKAAKIEL